MPFRQHQKTTDMVARVLVIIAIIIACLMAVQTMNESDLSKQKRTEFTQILEEIKFQNKRSIEDRKELHERLENARIEREKLTRRLNSLEER